MRPGETTPVGQAIVVAPAAAALPVQSQSTHWMMPVVVDEHLAAVEDLAGDEHAAAGDELRGGAGGDRRRRREASGGSLACAHSTTTGPPPPPVAGVRVQSASQPSPVTLLPSSHCSGACTIAVAATRLGGVVVAAGDGDGEGGGERGAKNEAR